MNQELLSEHVGRFVKTANESPQKFKADFAERAEHSIAYQAWTAQRLTTMTEEDFFEYISPLWAMRMWGNKHHVVDKAIADNGMAALRANLADLHGDPIRSRTGGTAFATTSKALAQP